MREGDPIVIATEPVELRGGRLASRALDNRLGVYVALEVARRVREAGGGAGPVAAVAAVQEEIGAHGARAMAFGLEPDVAIVVDVTHATDAPGVDAGELGEHGLGDGPVLTRGAIVSARVNDLLDEAAEAEGIESTTEVAGRATHTDADSIHLSRTGVPTAILSIPLRYMHSPVELVELADVEAAIALIAAWPARSGSTDADALVTRLAGARGVAPLRPGVGSSTACGHPLGHRLGREPDLLAQQRRLAVRDVAVGQADAQHARAAQQVAVGEVLEHRRAEAAGQHVLLDRHDQVVLAPPARSTSSASSGLAKRASATVGSTPCSSASRSAAPSATRHAVAVAEQRHALALAQQLAAADLDRLGPAGSGTPSASPRG